MKKGYIGLFLFLEIISISFVSAASYGNSFLADQSSRAIALVQDFIGPFFAAILGGFSGGYPFETILFFLIITSLVFVAVNRIDAFKHNKAVVWIVTLCVSILAVRFTAQTQWVEFVLLPYSVMGVAALSVLPFIIYFFFIQSFDSGTIRKMGWALYIVIYISMWYSQFGSIGDIAYIYLAAALLGLIMMAADKSVRGAMLRSMINKGLNDTATIKMVDLNTRIEQNLERLTHANTDRQRNALNHQISEDQKELKKLSKMF